MKLYKKNILLTGGAGFIGSHLADLLIQEGCHLRIVDNLVNGNMRNLIQHEGNNHYEFVRGDITEPSTASLVVKDVDIVFHLACLGVRHSISNPFENHKVNAEGTLTLLQEAFKSKIDKFIHCSSSEVYGPAFVVPMQETHPTFPCTIYGASKLAGEAYARSFYRTYGFKTVILRPFNTYGPRSHYEGNAGEFIPKSIIRAINGNPILIFGNGNQTRDFTFVEDMAKAIVEAAKYDNMIGNTYNIGSNFEISIKNLAEKILLLSGSKSGHIEYLSNRPGDVVRLYADPSAFSRLTKWEPNTNLEEGIIKTINWFNSSPESLSTMLIKEKGINWE